MSRSISPEKLTLRDLKEEFQLTQIVDPDFFPEWQQDLPILSEWEHQRLDRIYATYINHHQDSMLEETLKIVVIAPLLDLADFFLPPFRISSEEQIQISCKDEKTVYRGKIDILVLINQIWLLVIESKRQALSLSVGIPQALTYMLSNHLASNQTLPLTSMPLYGMVTNGSNFVFLKMMTVDGKPVYGKSDEFLIEKRPDRIQILQILKQIRQVFQ
jgi:Type I restriction enzyme R protein N terminus (HSDR_N)